MELEEADESIDPRVGFGFEDTHKSTCGSNAKAPRCSFGSVVLYAGAVLLQVSPSSEGTLSSVFREVGKCEEEVSEQIG